MTCFLKKKKINKQKTQKTNPNSGEDWCKLPNQGDVWAGILPNSPVLFSYSLSDLTFCFPSLEFPLLQSRSSLILPARTCAGLMSVLHALVTQSCFLTSFFLAMMVKSKATSYWVNTFLSNASWDGRSFCLQLSAKTHLTLAGVSNGEIPNRWHIPTAAHIRIWQALLDAPKLAYGASCISFSEGIAYPTLTSLRRQNFVVAFL